MTLVLLVEGLPLFKLSFTHLKPNFEPVVHLPKQTNKQTNKQKIRKQKQMTKTPKKKNENKIKPNQTKPNKKHVPVI